MNTYYEDTMTTIYTGDCRNYIKSLDFDFVLTDPPYGLPGEDIKIVLDVLGDIKVPMIVFSDWRNSHLIGALKSKVGELIWEYGWVSGGRTKAKFGILPTHNTIHCFGKPEDFKFTEGTILNRRPGFSSPRQCSYAKKSGHPYEKPVPLIEYLIQKSNVNVILDPFMGSGTTLVASRNLLKKSIGIEILEKYCSIAVERIK